jgi:hypothetical protein
LDGDFLGRSGKWGFRWKFEVLGLFMEKGGEQEKLIVFERETGASLGNTAFPEDQALTAFAEGIANEGPFLKTNAHGINDGIEGGECRSLF